MRGRARRDKDQSLSIQHLRLRLCDFSQAVVEKCWGVRFCLQNPQPSAKLLRDKSLIKTVALPAATHAKNARVPRWRNHGRKSLQSTHPNQVRSRAFRRGSLSNERSVISRQSFRECGSLTFVALMPDGHTRVFCVGRRHSDDGLA